MKVVELLSSKCNDVSDEDEPMKPDSEKKKPTKKPTKEPTKKLNSSNGSHLDSCKTGNNKSKDGDEGSSDSGSESDGASYADYCQILVGCFNI